MQTFDYLKITNVSMYRFIQMQLLKCAAFLVKLWNTVETDDFLKN